MLRVELRRVDQEGRGRARRAGKPGAQPLLWDDAAFSRVLKAKKADVFLYTPRDAQGAARPLRGRRRAEGRTQGHRARRAGRRSSPGRPAACWSTTSRTRRRSRPTGCRPRCTSRPNYEKGKSYPTIVYIYERLSQGLNRFTRADGERVQQVGLHQQRLRRADARHHLQGERSRHVGGVVRAAGAQGRHRDGRRGRRARVGLQGHSWGGYQTAFLVTQTNAFAAAVAGAPLTDMVSMYSLIYKNTGGDQPGGSSKAARAGSSGGYWDNWEAYYRNSPVFFAKNVKTPLMHPAQRQGRRRRLHAGRGVLQHAAADRASRS